MQGKRELNAIARSGERTVLTLTTSLSTTPVINKDNYAGLSGVRVSGSPTDLAFYVSNGDGDFRLFDVVFVGSVNAFVAPAEIWAFQKVKIVTTSQSGVYEIRLVG